VLTLPLLPIFHTECEYAVPAANAVAALERLRAIVEENDFDLKLPVEVRFSAQDDRLLSPSWDGPSCWIGASTEHNTAEVFARFEPLMVRFGGRPHWGKHFTLTREQLAGMYGPRLDEFVAHRDAFDPDRVFANTFLTDVLG
jgi:FAD/FMN-containing dehydrogenase